MYNNYVCTNLYNIIIIVNQNFTCNNDYSRYIANLFKLRQP